MKAVDHCARVVLDDEFATDDGHLQMSSSRAEQESHTMYTDWSSPPNANSSPSREKDKCLIPPLLISLVSVSAMPTYKL
jgi:hypothetical protein